MTTIVSAHAAPAAPARRYQGLADARAWVARWVHAFRAAAQDPRPEGMDPVALRLFGRDS